MTNFEDELNALVLRWLSRGDDPKSMSEALRNEIEQLMSLPRIVKL